MTTPVLLLTEIPRRIPDPHQPPRYRLTLGGIVLAEGLRPSLMPLYDELATDPVKARRLFMELSGQGSLEL